MQSYAACPGGIQTFARFVVRALGELYPEAEICVFAKYDRRTSSQQSEVSDQQVETEPSPITRVIGFGNWPGPMRAMAFAVGVIWRAVWIWRLPDDVPTIIISTHVNFAPMGRVVQRLGKIRFCAIGHGIEVWDVPKANVRKALRAADQLVAVSDFTRQRMARVLEINPDRIEILPNTFDAERFRPGPKPAALLQRYGLAPEQPVILTVARLAATEQYKGYDQVLRALPAVLRQFPQSRYVIVGDGPDRGRVERLSKELRVEERVVFAGYVPNEELAGHYNLCDVFVMPSKGEGFGIVFLEALSCGKPVIAGNKDASVEAVLGGKLGMLVDPDDVAAIANAISRILAATGGQTSEVSSQRSEAETGGQRADDGGQRTEVGGRGAEAGGQTSEVSSQWSEAETGGQGADDGGRRAETGGQTSEVSSQRTEAGTVANAGEGSERSTLNPENNRGRPSAGAQLSTSKSEEGAAGTAATTGEERRAADGSQKADGGRRNHETTDNGPSQPLNPLTLNSTELRREVISAYGFPQFRRRLGEIVRKIESIK